MALFRVGALVATRGRSRARARYRWDLPTRASGRSAAGNAGMWRRTCTPDRDRVRFEIGDAQALPVARGALFRDFDDCWSPFLGGQGPAPGYAVSLSVKHREELRERIRVRTPVGPDGSIRLTARAWAGRGTKGSAQRR